MERKVTTKALKFALAMVKLVDCVRSKELMIKQLKFNIRKREEEI